MQLEQLYIRNKIFLGTGTFVLELEGFYVIRPIFIAIASLPNFLLRVLRRETEGWVKVRRLDTDQRVSNM